MSDPSHSPVEHLRELTNGFIIPRCIYAVAKLGIADQLEDGARTAADLAEAVEVQPRALYRVLRALAGVGVFREEPGERFTLTPVGEALRASAPDSLRAYIVMNHEFTFPSMGELVHTLRTGEPGFDKAFGAPFFDYFNKNPQQFDSFQAAMESVHRAWSIAVAEEYDFSVARRVVDVGGGNGSQLSAILQRHDHLSGVLFEQAGAIAAAKAGGGGSLPRCEFVVGDFFEEVASGGDIYILRRIIHDWNDEQATVILRSCLKAMGDNSRLLIIEGVPGPANQPSWAHLQDVTMLACLTGMERTVEEYGHLMSTVGLRLDEVVPTQTVLSILVAVPTER